MELGQIVLLVLGVAVLIFIFGYAAVKTVIEGIFSRRERPEYTAHLQFKDITKEDFPELIKFPSGKNMLQGYLFGKGNTKGLVVVVHGLGGGAEGYLPESLFFCKQGYRVFAYDNTGYHLSEGKNSVGLPQAVEDLDAALSFIEAEAQFAGIPVYLFGHSWGGYAVTAILNFDHKITAATSLSGFGDPNKMIKEWARRMVGKWSNMVNPFMVLHQRLRFGKKLDLMAVDGINKAEIPVLLAHGNKDITVRLDGSALISCKEEITNPRVQYVLWETENQNGHLDILYDVEANEYSKQISKDYERLMKLTKKKLAKEDKEEFFANVDKARSSVCNKELMGRIVEFFEGVKMQNIIDRVRQMEQYMDEVAEALENNPGELKTNEDLRAKVEILTNYMDSGLWISDYEADERGELPRELKRGVLSQDGLYNLICDVEEFFGNFCWKTFS